MEEMEIPPVNEDVEFFEEFVSQPEELNLPIITQSEIDIPKQKKKIKKPASAKVIEGRKKAAETKRRKAAELKQKAAERDSIAALQPLTKIDAEEMLGQRFTALEERISNIKIIPPLPMITSIPEEIGYTSCPEENTGRRFNERFRKIGDALSPGVSGRFRRWQA
jgi:hypothetical protein